MHHGIGHMVHTPAYVPPSGGFSIWGGSPSIRGVLHPGGSPSGGFSIQGGSPSGGFSIWEGGWGSPSRREGGLPCDLSHHAFDVTCMLLPHQLRPTNSAAAYIVLVGHVTCKASWDTTPLPCEQNHTRL